MEKPGNSAETADTLERLLEVEARLDERLQSCLAEAERLMDEARDEAARREERFERTLREERAERLRAREVRLAEAVRVERDRAARRIRRLRAVASEDVEELARRVVGRVLEDIAT